MMTQYLKYHGDISSFQVNVIPTQILISLFLEQGKLIVKFIQKNKTCKNSQENTGEKSYLQDIIMHCNALIIKTVRLAHRQINGTGWNIEEQTQIYVEI